MGGVSHLTLIAICALPPPLDVSVEFVLVIPVVRQRGVNLTEREVRMLEMHFFRAVPKGLALDNQFDDFRPGAGDDRNAASV